MYILRKGSGSQNFFIKQNALRLLILAFNALKLDYILDGADYASHPLMNGNLNDYVWKTSKKISGPGFV